MNNNKINVLIIDDEQNTLNSFKAHFRTIFNVYTAIDTDLATSIIAENNIEVILCDYNMPKKDGILFFSELILTHPDISRILITAHDDINIAIEGINIGSIYRYVHKPWNLEELKIIIEQSFEFHKLKIENQRLMDRLLSNDRLIELLENNQ